MVEIDTLNDSSIRLEIGEDGPSLPILIFDLFYRDKRINGILLDKDQTYELISVLQRLVTEM